MSRTSPTRVTGEIAASCLCRRVRAVSRRITNLYDEALRPTGLTANQLTVLVAVERAGPIGPTALGEKLGMEKSTVSRTAARMVERGWLADSPGGGPRRAFIATAAGRERIQAAHGPWRQAQRQARLAFGDELSKPLLSLLQD